MPLRSMSNGLALITTMANKKTAITNEIVQFILHNEFSQLNETLN